MKKSIAISILAVVSMASGACPRTSAASKGVLYQASWRHGLHGWRAVGSGFGTRHGTLTYTGNASSEIIAPFRRPLTDFAVSAKIRSLSFLTDKGNHGFGIVAREDPRPEDSGIFAGLTYAAGNIGLNGAAIHWTERAPDFIGGKPLKASTGWHSYRLEVHGTIYRLLIDGKQVIPYTTISSYGGLTGVGLWSTFTKLTVSSFKVISLVRQKPGQLQDTRPLESRMLTRADGATSAFRQTLGLFRGNEEFARLNGIALSTVRKKGRLLSYNGFFQQGDDTVIAALLHFKNRSGAHWGVNFLAGSDRGLLRRYGVHPEPVPKIGSETQALQWTVSEGGQVRHEIRIYFRQKSYAVTLTVISGDGAKARVMSVALARKLSTRIRRAIRA